MSTVSGALIFDKPAGITSQTAVNIVRRIFGTKKVGHTGTLDPMATGVLVILVGNAVKASELLVTGEKIYEATIKLGITTDTQDTTGKTLSVFEGTLPTLEELKAVLPAFTGDISQLPPMYSALKVGGKKLYELARQGIEAERTERDITVSQISAEKTEKPDEFRLRVRCSKGTYIRTLCDDIGRTLGCGAAMAALRRISNGGFDISQAIGEEELKSLESPESVIIPTDKLFADLPEVRLSAFYSKLAHCGNEIYIKKIGLSAELSQRFRLYDDGGSFFAIAECTEFPNGYALKNIKMFC